MTITDAPSVTRSQPTKALWRNTDFLKVWAAQSISLFGSEVTNLAIPLTAALTLQASAVQMGLLAAAGQAPFLLFSLFAGVWVDRRRRRTLLLAADIGRAILLLSVPLAALLHLLTMPHLYVVAFAVGVLSVVFEVAHYAYIPALLPRQQLVDGNSKLQISYSIAESAGPGIGGILVQILSAPFAVVLDAVSFILSALALWTVHTPEPLPESPIRAQRVRQAIGEGLRALVHQPLLRPIVVASALSGVCTGATSAMYVLYATRELQLVPIAVGIVFAAGGVGAIPGAMLAGWVARRIGIGRAILGGWLVSGLTGLIVPFAAGSVTRVVALLVAAQVVGGVAATIANIHQWSLRQAVTPDHLGGRVTASHRFIVYGAAAVGASVSGVVAATVGLRYAMLLFAVGALLPLVWALWSPLRGLREMPPEAAGA